jgi:glycosyltransferase involved in cell wall biosynthesis
MNYTIVITNRDEPHLKKTVDRILATAKPDEILVVNDGCDEQDVNATNLLPWSKPRGVQQCRDYGIEHARNETIIIMDAHMQFRDDGWADKMAEWSERNETALGCAVCVSICPVTYEIAEDCPHCIERSQKQAELGAKVKPPTKRYGATLGKMLEARGENRIFPSKWNYDGKAGEVQSILGGCYVLNRDWYIHGLARPWAGMRSWGMSEQTISIVNWICGGSSNVLDVEVGHLFRTGEQCEYQNDLSLGERLEFMAGVWYNRFRLIDVLPMSGALHKELSFWLAGNHIRSGVWSKLKQWQAIDTDEALIAHLADQGPTLDDYLKEYDL